MRSLDWRAVRADSVSRSPEIRVFRIRSKSPQSISLFGRYCSHCKVSSQRGGIGQLLRGLERRKAFTRGPPDPLTRSAQRKAAGLAGLPRPFGEM